VAGAAPLVKVLSAYLNPVEDERTPDFRSEKVSRLFEL
jgi:hypothetical protein